MQITLGVPLTRSGKIIASLMAEHGDNLSTEQIISNLRAEIDSPYPYEPTLEMSLHQLRQQHSVAAILQALSHLIAV